MDISAHTASWRHCSPLQTALATSTAQRWCFTLSPRDRANGYERVPLHAPSDAPVRVPASGRMVNRHAGSSVNALLLVSSGTRRDYSGMRRWRPATPPLFVKIGGLERVSVGGDTTLPYRRDDLLGTLDDVQGSYQRLLLEEAIPIIADRRVDDDGHCLARRNFLRNSSLFDEEGLALQRVVDQGELGIAVGQDCELGGVDPSVRELDQHLGRQLDDFGRLLYHHGRLVDDLRRCRELRCCGRRYRGLRRFRRCRRFWSRCWRNGGIRWRHWGGCRWHRRRGRFHGCRRFRSCGRWRQGLQRYRGQRRPEMDA